MNLIDAQVTRILSKPKYKEYDDGINFWWIEIEYIDMGGKGESTVTFNNYIDALLFKVGTMILH